MAELSNWTRFFEDLSQFLQAAERQYGIGNYNFSEFVVERLDLCISTCTALSDHLVGDAVPDLDEEDATVVAEYHSILTNLLSCMRSLHRKWIEYMDVIDASTVDFSYRAGIEQIGRGRPRFEISQSQLEYLASLSFSWSEIASLLGVSRMTIYR